jgi:flagellar basal-body rod protein FlgC
MRVQSERMKIVAQNIANSDSTPSKPGEKPYRRKIISFENKKDPITGTDIVTVKKIARDYQQAFKARYDPYHPAADADGYVLLPNIKRDIEMLDMKEAERSYQANLGTVETSKSMYLNTLDLLR